MSAMKKNATKKKPSGAARARTGSVKPPTKIKYAIPAIETTALEESLEPVDAKERLKPKNKKEKTRRPLVMPGYFTFTAEVWRVLWEFKSTFWRLVLVYAVLSGLFVGLASQAVYAQLSELIRETGGEILSGNIAKVGEASELMLAGLTGGLNPEIGEAQQFFGGMLVILIWLTTVWLLRALLAGHSPRLRDGFYNSGAPLVPTFMLSFLFIIQLIPAAIAAIAIAVAMPAGIISGGIVMALFWIIALLLILLSLYWITSTFIALIIVTLPGMYPMKALNTARELVAGRRLRIILRMLWMAVLSTCFWVVVMVPIILLDAWVKGWWQAIEWLPVVPVALLLMGSVTLIWIASYSYLLYRKVVDDGSQTT